MQQLQPRTISPPPQRRRRPQPQPRPPAAASASAFDPSPSPSPRLQQQLIRGRDLVEDDGVEGDLVGKLDALAADDDGQIGVLGHHGDQGGAEAGVKPAVAHHRVRAQKDLGGVAGAVGQGVDVAVGDVEAGGDEGPCQGPAFEQRPRVDDDDAEGGGGAAPSLLLLLSLLLLAMVSLEQGLLHDAALGKGEDDVAGLDLVGGAGGDDLVGDGDAVPDEVVDGAAEAGFGFGFGRGRVDVVDLKFEPADGVAHGDGEWPAGDEVVDLGREMGGEVAREGVLWGGHVGLDDLGLNGLSERGGGGGWDGSR